MTAPGEPRTLPLRPLGATLANTAVRPPDPPAGVPFDVIAGRYRLVRPAGEGGMGVVFEAEQVEPVHRTVAVKLLKPGAFDAAARFDAERQALARMDHPHIAKVFDAGTAPDGRPFVVMEFVRGVPLGRYAAGLPGLRPRLELFVLVCQAVQHAHQKGVIHRDLKPSNVLVDDADGTPAPKVIDFGLAKAVGDPLSGSGPDLTAAGQVVGTLLYMAPEQTGGADADTRADVYALGAILYELLAGVTPLDRQRLATAPLPEQVRMIREDDPTRPSRRSPAAGVPADLDWIALKALDKNPDRRYPTAVALADDVRRFLADESVSAAPPSGWYTAKKFVRRNRTAVLAAAAVLVAIGAGVVGTVAGLVRATRAEAVARAAQADAEAERAAAVADRDAAETARGRTAAANKRATDALSALTDGVIDDLFSRRAGLTDDDRAFLRKVADIHDRASADAGGGADAEVVRITGLVRVAGLRSRAGDRADAEQANRQAVAIADKLLAAAAPSADARAAAGHAYHRLAITLLTFGRAADAIDFARRAVEQRDIVAAGAGDPQAVIWAAESRLRYGSCLALVGRPDEATIETRRAVADLARLPAAGRVGQEARFLRADARVSLGSRTLDADPAAAEADFRAAAEEYARLAAELPSSGMVRSKVGLTTAQRAAALDKLGRPADADAARREAIAGLDRAVADQPGYLDHRVNLAGVLASRSVARLRAGDSTTTAADATTALDHLAHVLRLDPRNAPARVYAARSRATRAEVATLAGRHADAVADWRAGVEFAAAADRDRYRLSLAVALAAAGKADEAAAIASEAAGRAGGSAALKAAAGFVLAGCGAKHEPAAEAALLAAAAAGHRAFGELVLDAKLSAFRRRPAVAELLARTGPHREAAPRPRPGG